MLKCYSISPHGEITIQYVAKQSLQGHFFHFYHLTALLEFYLSPLSICMRMHSHSLTDVLPLLVCCLLPLILNRAQYLTVRGVGSTLRKLLCYIKRRLAAIRRLCRVTFSSLSLTFVQPKFTENRREGKGIISMRMRAF